MAENKPKPIEFTFAATGESIKFEGPDNVRDWAQNELKLWQWLVQGGQQARSIYDIHDRLKSQLLDSANTWRNWSNDNYNSDNARRAILDLLENYYNRQQRVLYSKLPASVFVLQLQQEHGPIVAAGAYAAVLNIPLASGAAVEPLCIEGMFKGFLYRNNIDFSGSANAAILEGLRLDYQKGIDAQKTNLQELENKNAALNQSFEKVLGERDGKLKSLLDEQQTALGKLHRDQSEEFNKVLAKHVEQLKSIETTYDQKLALQSPVKYWQRKETFHGKQAKSFAAAAGLTMLGIAAGVAWLTYEVLYRLGQNENPRSWQIGFVAIVAFFSIWLLRVLVRMFLSHVHLATDAAERRTMVLTYLALVRSGPNFDPGDKKLILESLFRTTSDGLVKDDAAPATPLEMLSRVLH